MALFGRKAKEDPTDSGGPVLRATSSARKTYDDPSEDLLYRLAEELKDEQDFFNVVRAQDGSGETYAQVIILGGKYVVELRDGSKDTHQHAVTSDLRAVHQDVVTWAYSLDRELVLDWQPGQF